MKKTSSLTKKLAAYSAVATIAVGAGAVHATGVLISVPPANQVIGVGQSFDIDFDQDGRPEFRIVQETSFTGQNYIRIKPASMDGDFGSQLIGSGGASNLSTGQPINSTVSQASFTSAGNGPFLDLAYGTSRGPFGGTNGYIGVVFGLDGNGPFYGWIELAANFDATQATISRYYYDTTVGGSPAFAAGQSPTAVTMSDVATTTASNSVGVMALLTGALAALSGIGLWVRERVFGRDEG